MVTSPITCKQFCNFLNHSQPVPSGLDSYRTNATCHIHQLPLVTYIISFTSSRLLLLVRGRRQAHNPTLAKIMRLAYDRSHSHNRPQTAACNAVYSISRRALMITRLGEHLPRPRQVSMRGGSKLQTF